MKRLLRRCGTACALGFAFILVLPPEARPARTISAVKVAAELAAGRPFVDRSVVVRGRLDLSRADTVGRVFVCHECVFKGGIVASNVTFMRTVDLSGSTFGGAVNFAGANFSAPALFRAVEPVGAVFLDRPQQCAKLPLPACFRGRTDFSLAVFHDLASFDGSRFLKPSSFRDTRFTDGTFNSTRFTEASFDGSAFRAAALFNDARFAQTASFANADFRGRTDFSIAHFPHGADFSGGQFAQGASFFAAQFGDPGGSTMAARFQGATAAGDLNFTFASFLPAGGRQVTANFFSFVSGSALVLRDLTRPELFELIMDRAQVSDLRMDVADVEAVGAEEQRRQEEQQRRVLAMLETSAKNRGDLAEANDAHYALEALKSRDYSKVGRVLDYVFYRGIAGYLVRPTRPIFVLLLLVAILSVIRTIARRADPDPPESRHSRSRAAWRWGARRCSDLVTSVLDTFSLIGPRRAASEQLSVGQRLESFAYRLLVVCALLGLANSNPTLRQMVDTLF